MSSCSSRCSNRKRRDHRLPIASSPSSSSSPAEATVKRERDHRLPIASSPPSSSSSSSSSSSPAEATVKRELDHYQVLDVESGSTSAHIKRACRLLARKDESLEDMISGLPDDILVNIISRLTLAEAAATSVLSTRWKYLWTFITVLNFDALNLLMNLNEETLGDERTWYVNWVNKVLQSHRGLSIDEFKVGFDLDASHESDITNWIYTVVLKGVQKIELSFYTISGGLSRSTMYTFPQELYDRLKTPCFLSSIKSLRSLYLDSVNVTGEILEFFIYNCPYLEELRVIESLSLLRLKVIGPLLRLKYLDINFCLNLEELEISCPSLLSFEYDGPIIKYCIKNVPRLVDLSIRWDILDRRIGVRRVVGPIGSYFPRLETLKLDVELNEESNQFPKCELSALRHLELRVRARRRSNLLDLTCMMKSCPLLQKLVLEMFLRRYSTEVRSRHQYPKCSHQHLKVVEWFGFSGNPVELELAHYLLENTSKLEKLLLRSWRFLSDGADVAREQAKKLKEVVPPGVELVFEVD